MSNSQSEPLRAWLNERAQAIDALAAGHAHIGGLTDRRGRPLDVSKPLAHAYIIVMMRELQGFVRDLHRLTAQSIVDAAVSDLAFGGRVFRGLTDSRFMDRGNATSRSIKQDFSRLGVSPIDIGLYNPRWNTDAAKFNVLIELRNALGHGNESQLARILKDGKAKDTVTWARNNRAVLNRYGRSLDRIVWDSLSQAIGRDPWP